MSFDSDNVGFWPGLREVYGRMSRVRRRQFYLLLVLMLLAAFAELATIGAVLPFLSLLADPTELRHFGWTNSVFDVVRADDPGERIVTAMALLTAFTIFAGVIRLALARSTLDFGYQLGHEITVEVQRRLLLQPYSFHVQRHSSTLLAALEKAEILVFQIVLPLMQAAIAAFIATAIVAVLFYIDPFTAAFAAAALSTIYVLVSVIGRKRLATNSAIIEKTYDERMKIVQEGFGGIRDVIIDNSQSFYVRMFETENAKLNQARATTAFLASSPRVIIETVGIVVIAGLAAASSQRGAGLEAALPVLGAVALGGQRLLPLVQQMYSGWSTAAGYFSIVGQMIELLRLPIGDEHADPEPRSRFSLGDRISIESVGFSYPTRSGFSLCNVSFDILFGSTVAFIGETGSGKSTLADLLMGLIEPTEGDIRIDGQPLTRMNSRQWQRNIAHVPQSIFLADASIAFNIALSVDPSSIDRDRMIAAARGAQLHDFIMSLPEDYEARVGERGIRLSGGQRQRLGIARALYMQTPLLVLDEATNALDEATEVAVLEGLTKLGDQGRTIILISHRLSAVAGCDRVARFHSGRCVDFGSFTEVASTCVKS